MKLSRTISALAFCTLTPSSWAFDIHTHAAMTVRALEQSKLGLPIGTNELRTRLGLRDPSGVLTDRYIGFGPTTLRRGSATDWEGAVMGELEKIKFSGLPESFSIGGWVMRGAIREDDTTVETPLINLTDVDTVPVFDRAFGHFFDPINNLGILTKFGSRGPTASDWALVPGIKIRDGLNPLGGQENYFKITDAREAMWRALTLKQINADGTLETIVPVGGLVSYAADEAERKAYWAATFRTLGDTVHLLQDMAQPQHTRDDKHSGFGCISPTNPDAPCAGGHASFIELYLKARTLESRKFSLDETSSTTVPPVPGSGTARETKVLQLNYAGYPKPSFANYRDFFVTATGAASATGRGLANYSNRGFYSFGTNIHSGSSFPNPSPTGAGLGTELLNDGDIQDMTGKTIPGVMLLRTRVVEDFATGVPSLPARLSASGLWDQFLVAHGSVARHTLNYYNYDDQAKLLVPRAVAYSAGLIDYFFRGEIDIALPDAGVYAVADHAVAKRGKVAGSDYDGFTKIKAKLKNITPSITPSGTSTEEMQSMASGIFVAVVKYRLNDCYKSDLSGETLYTAQNTLVNPVGCNMSGTNSPLFTTQVEEIVTSQPGVDANGVPVTSLSLSNYTEVSFTFAQSIPINATDVYLQVVFRGRLGSEEDAVVVATKDISEPSYFTIANATDYLFCVNDKLYRNDADGSVSAAARNAIAAAGGSPTIADAITSKKLAHSRVLMITQPPYSSPFSSYNPLTVNPQVKVLADKEFLGYGQNLRMVYLTDRAAGLGITNVNQFAIGIADDVLSGGGRPTRLEYYAHDLHQTYDQDTVSSAFTIFRDFRWGSSTFTVNSYGASCTSMTPDEILRIDHTSPSASTLVEFTRINF